MRVKTEFKKRWIAIPLIFLSAFLLFCLSTVWSATAVSDTYYLEADVTVGGELLPSSLTYTGSDFSFGYRLYKSSDGSVWTIDEDAQHRANFQVRYYDADHNELLDGNTPLAPSDVGTYYVRVVAKDVIDESSVRYLSNVDSNRMIAEKVFVCEKLFTITHEDLSLFCTPLDRSRELVLDDINVNYYSSVTSGVSLLLNGAALTPETDYTFSVQRHNGSAFVDTAEISTVGTYRLKVKIKTALLGCTAATSLAAEDIYSVFCREFSVTRATVSLALTSTSMYEDATSAVALTEASKTKLSTTIGVTYKTQVLLRLSTGDTDKQETVMATSDSPLSYTPTEAGEHIYRVTFTSANAGYGISVGDRVDLSFTVKAIPYEIRYSINNSKTRFLDYEIINTDGSAISLSPKFVDLQGESISGVFNPNGSKRYDVFYTRYDDSVLPAEWVPLTGGDLPQSAGKYRVIVSFNADADIEDGYTITSGGARDNIVKEFRLVTTSNGGVCYYTGSAVAPELFFVSTAADNVPDLVADKYTTTYFDLNNDPVTPTAVGEYYFHVKFNEAIEVLGVLQNAEYHGKFRIEYHTLSVFFGDEIVFTDGETDAVVTPTYHVDYYEVSDNFSKLLASEPTLSGRYKKVVVFDSPLAVYRISMNGIVSHEYTISGDLARCDFTVDRVTYDGGAKQAKLSFQKNGVSVALAEYEDYTLTYFKAGVPCGTPILAGNYSCLVTFLRTDEVKGLKRGEYFTATLIVDSRNVSVFYEIDREASVDTFYDAQDKVYNVTLRYSDNGHPLSDGVGKTITYAENAASPVFDVTPFKNAGDYLVKTTLADDKSGSLVLVDATMPFTIAQLSFQVRFTVPLSYRAMWTGSEVSPLVKYVALNGRFADGTAYTAAQFKDKGIVIYDNPSNESKSYFSSEDGVVYETPVIGAPTLTGKYLQKITKNNDNVKFYSASAIGDDGSSVTTPIWTESEVSQPFFISPREVEVSVDYDADLYFTGSSEGDRKGVSQVHFNAYNLATSAYDVPVLDFDGEHRDYTVLYYSSDYKGTISGDPLGNKPTEKSYYVARIVMIDDESDADDDSYLTEGRYTFKSGKNAVDDDLDVALYFGCYVDFVFRIMEQNKLDVIYEMPETFAQNGVQKEISVTFLNNFSEVPLTEGVGNDYTITYYDDNDVLLPGGAPSTVGKYKVKVTFLKDNVAYVINSYVGSYDATKEGDVDLYLSEGDVLTYAFEIFEPRALNVVLHAPSSFYYNGQQKTYNVEFTVTEKEIDSIVTLTKGTHYRLNYYILEDADTYTKIDYVPTLPGNYAVEVEFLTDLPDFTFVIDEVAKPIDHTLIYTIDQKMGSYDEAKTQRADFTIQKARLVIEGIKVNDKIFDGTSAATFTGTPVLSVKKIDDEPCGAMVKENGVFPFYLTGTVAGVFVTTDGEDLVETDLPGRDIKIKLTSYYDLSEGADALYDLDDPLPFTATISKRTLTVKPVDVTREYNPLAVNSVIKYSVIYGDTEESANKTVELLAQVTSSNITAEKENVLVGALSREEGSSVGWYKIILDASDPLSLNDEEAGLYEGKNLSDLFELVIEDVKYRIVERSITITVKEGIGKIYGDKTDPEIELVVSSGSLIYGDKIVCNAVRAAGENAGTYKVTLSDASIVTESGNADMSGNYRITLVNGTFTIAKRRLEISPNNQIKTYIEGFDPFDIVVYDKDQLVNNRPRNVTADYVTTPTGDRLSGKLAIEETSDPFVYNILQGSVTLVNANKKNVASNYEIEYIAATYTLTRKEIIVSFHMEEGELTKYYGDKDPIFRFTYDETQLGNLTLSDRSSVSRQPGEDAGTYYFYNETTEGEAGGFRVMDAGIDVTRYFNFKVTGIAGNSFNILPRPITITVEDETYENTGREVVPVIKYLNANGTRLSSSIIQLLKLNVVVPTIEYKDGVNLVTPEVEGEVKTDPNFEVTFTAGKITMIYLQNRVTATPVDKSDKIYEGRKYLLSGIMLYKTVKIYKLETANGEQPDRNVEIALPIDGSIKGEGLVVVALYADAASRAFTFKQSGASIVYSDDGAYYAVIAEVQDWFYVIWGVVLIAAGVVIYFLVLLTIKIVKKQRAKRATMPAKEKRRKKKDTGAASFAPNSDKPDGVVAEGEPTSESSSDSLFSDSAITTETPAAPAAESLGGDIPENTDHLFTDEMLTDTAPVAPVAAPSDANAPAQDAVVDDSALDFDIPMQNAFEGTSQTPTDSVNEQTSTPVPTPEEAVQENGKKKGKEKKKKEKSEKPDKKKKKKEENDQKPKGFTPSSFKPKGDKRNAYTPATRSYQDDLFIEEAKEEENNLLSDAAITTTDNAIVPPATDPNATAAGSDELIIARGTGFTDDDPNDPDGKGGGGDGDLL